MALSYPAPFMDGRGVLSESNRGRSGVDIEIAADTRRVAAYRALPAAGHGKAVLVFSERPELTGFTRDACDRLARAGFSVLAPAFDRTEEGDFEPDSVADVLDAAVAECLNHDATDGSRIGILGFGAGGVLAVLAAARSSRVGAVVDFYGAPEDEELAEADLSSVAASVLCIFGQQDPAVDEGAAHEFEAQLAIAAVRVRLQLLPDAGFGFMDDSRVEHFVADAAQSGWDAVLAYFGAEL
jgi:carboxymethylenebutenolidase